jgi:tRNA nucleotidyltransferase/poly(A) polymerase
MQDMSKLINDDLRGLRKQFQAKGFDIRIVGGAVRDFLNGQIPSDVDLCTDATPDEQLALYQEFGLHFIPTGVQHGTYTVVMNGEGYEITSLRTESEHDGRYAKMAFTKDWTEDASRRDLTINAISLTFDGEVVDPFNGYGDLMLGNVRFVGDPAERMEEDYLRILRYFRFLGRYGSELSARKIVPADALYRAVHGLANISAERIWSEMKKIIAHPSAVWILPLMEYHSVLDVIKFPGTSGYDAWRFFELKKSGCTDPVLLTVACMYIIDRESVDRLAVRLKWSSDEIEVARKIADYRDVLAPIAEAKYQLIHNRHPHAEEGMKYVLSKSVEFYTVGRLVDFFKAFVKPQFPITGDDLIARGFKPGQEVGVVLKQLKNEWMNSNYEATREQLLEVIRR